MRNILRNTMLAILSLAILSVLISAADSSQSPQQAYIQKYAAIAVSEMYRTGVPASITLAQGILESNSGNSALTVNGNNHFGIKCHDWTGKRQYHDDDAKGECFRVYDSAEQSFKDHSDFLRYRDRYKFLFDNDVTDYKSWAYGLKKAGYATDPSYPTKLINIIETYNLSRYDTMTVDDAVAVSDPKVVALPQKSKAEKVKSKVKGKNRTKTAVGATNYKDKSAPSIPESPLSIEEAKPLEKGTKLEEFRFSLSRQMYSRNGVPFVSSVDGESYATIAASYNLFVKELLSFNDLKSEKQLEPGTVVYLQAKKTQAAAGLDKYIVEKTGESLWEICQRFGVKMSSVQKMNGFSESYQPKEGDTILLRPVSGSKKSKK